MAFGKTDPSEILGMSQDEFAAKLGEIDSLKTQLTELTAASKKSSEGMDSVLAQLQQLNKPKEPEDDPDFISDPDRAFSSRLKPVLEQTLNNSIMLQHNAFRERFPRDFEKWGQEIVKRVGEYSPENQTSPRVWEDAVMYVRGRHADEIEKSGAQGNFGYLEPVSAGLRPDPKTSDNLTGPEREMVRTLAPFGMTTEKYNRGKERLAKARSARLGRFAEVN